MRTRRKVAFEAAMPVKPSDRSEFDFSDVAIHNDQRQYPSPLYLPFHSPFAGVR